MTPKRYAAALRKIALTPNNATESEIQELAAMPEYHSFESFVQEIIDEMDDSFTLADARVLVFSFYKQWVRAGKPDPKDPNTEIRPMNVKEVIDVLRGEWGLQYDTKGEPPPPKQVVRPFESPDPAKADARSIGR